MNRRKLAKVKLELQEMRKSPQGRRADDFISIAKSLGRVEDRRGKEPTYVREREPHLAPPLSIPRHGATDMKVGTARSIIDQLLDDCDEWSIFFDQFDEQDEGSDAEQ